MKKLCLAVLLAACQDSEAEPACRDVELRGYAVEHIASGTRLWADSLPAGAPASWHMEIREDDACGGNLRLDFFDSRRQGPVVSFHVDAPSENEEQIARVWGGDGVTAGFLALGGDSESTMSGHFQAVVDGETIDGVFRENVESQACVADDWLRSLEFVRAEELLGVEGELVDCEHAVAAEAADCIAAAVQAGDGFSAAWQDASGSHAYVGTPWEVDRYDFTRASDAAGSYARVSRCADFARQDFCEDFESCWTCAPGQPSDMCREPS